MKTTIVWFGNDLRIRDNPALFAASERGAVVMLFIFSPEEYGDRPPGSARRWWLHYSLQSLNLSLSKLGVSLILRRASDSLSVLKEIINQTGADAVYWNRRYEPQLRERDKRIAQELKMCGIEVKVFDSYLLHDPDKLLTDSNQPYTVFTPFWKRFLKEVVVMEPLPAPERLIPPKHIPVSERIEDLELLPKIDWAEGLRKTWQPGEESAHQRLERFLSNHVGNYHTLRDRPDLDATSRLSPHLLHGEISPRQIWHSTMKKLNTETKAGIESFLREIGWREFAYHILYHYPHTQTHPLKAVYENFPWSKEYSLKYKAWTKGFTGIPIVDAGMRQLWSIGWMHNRVRMIVASWLTKNLLHHWQLGERWFWDTLVDADPASNVLGWQWTAGCGADSVPYRIFNPVLQGRKFDPEGNYVRQWVPELSSLPTEYIHAPWEAPPQVLKKAGIVLGKTYPMPHEDITKSYTRTRAIFEQWAK